MGSLFTSKTTPETVLGLWLFSVCLFALLGNAASDIWLVATVLLFLAVSAYSGDWTWLKMRWVQAAILFWLWLIISAALSAWPEESLKKAALWIRFPILAAAIAVLCGSYPSAKRAFLAGLIAALAVMSAVLLFEKFSDPDRVRLYGTWTQSTKAGWLMAGFGLPFSFWALGKISESRQAALLALPAVSLILIVIFLTGEIYMTLLFLFGIGIFLIASGIAIRRVLLFAGLTVCSLPVIFLVAPNVFVRFRNSIETRLPWLPSSDYYVPWVRGLETGKLNPIAGIGPHNYEMACNSTAGVKSLFEQTCFPHPHQLYIQTFAETGAIGLFLFLLLIGALFYHVIRAGGPVTRSVGGIAALCLLLSVFWPVSTYSNAFGQHRNFFTWIVVGWALTLVMKNGAPEQKKC